MFVQGPLQLSRWRSRGGTGNGSHVSEHIYTKGIRLPIKRSSISSISEPYQEYYVYRRGGVSLTWRWVGETNNGRCELWPQVDKSMYRIGSCGCLTALPSQEDRIRITIQLCVNGMPLSWVFVPWSTVSPSQSRTGCQNCSRTFWQSILTTR